jgi:hypothetical protein
MAQRRRIKQRGGASSLLFKLRESRATGTPAAGQEYDQKTERKKANMQKKKRGKGRNERETIRTSRSSDKNI